MSGGPRDPNGSGPVCFLKHDQIKDPSFDQPKESKCRGQTKEYLFFFFFCFRNGDRGCGLYEERSIVCFFIIVTDVAPSVPPLLKGEKKKP